jgi:hypothetical protein
MRFDQEIVRSSVKTIFSVGGLHHCRKENYWFIDAAFTEAPAQADAVHAR